MVIPVIIGENPLACHYVIPADFQAESQFILGSHKHSSGSPAPNEIKDGFPHYIGYPNKNNFNESCHCETKAIFFRRGNLLYTGLLNDNHFNYWLVGSVPI
jgi:hypothetical protein